MPNLPTKQAVQQALQAFSHGNLKSSALALFEALGYRSNRRFELDPNTGPGFVESFNRAGRLNPERALLAKWQTVEILFQLTGDDIRQTPQLGLFTSGRVDNTIIESYLFIAIRLAGSHYTRTQLAQITREVNKPFDMPVLVLFEHDSALTLAVINRRLHKRDEAKDVLEKVTLIKDIRLSQPHRAHIEILSDLALSELYDKHRFTSFVELHRAWQQTLDNSELNKRFFREVANWYFWAVQAVTFPREAHPDPEVRHATSVIRLITRLIFVWFLKEKGLVPDDLFNEGKLKTILKTGADPKGSAYYKAILQNLFFATLNQEMNTPGQPGNRKFRGKAGQSGGRDQHYMIHNVYRYEDYFQQPQQALKLFANIPFLNGGLFECLDKEDPDIPKTKLRIDGFSDRADNPLAVPDDLFFGGEREVDLNETYGTSSKTYKVRGLIRILDRYKFTVDENTPIEEEIALDPEMLGQVFENLLAAYNPETGVTARKQTGSFYTPREIVNYMVDESLIAYLESKANGESANGDKAGHSPFANSSFQARLRHLLAYNDQPHPFSPAEVTRLIEAIDNAKILDPAAGSGAFPMGILHKLVFILGKLDPHNERWKEKQLDKAGQIPDATIRDRAMADIEEAFERNELDYGRKLYLIENCIYGVDIQPIAVQIAKLRFFISLVVDQRIDETLPNRGIRPLPNLETKFVAANTLLGIGRPQQMLLRNAAIDQKEAELAEVRRNHFTARTPKTKEKYRQFDQKLRTELGELLRQDGFLPGVTEKLAHWNPYDQNAAADFFDPEWMFGLSAPSPGGEGRGEGGFDIVIGNPPYVRHEQIKPLKPFFQKNYQCFTGTADLYVYFYERSIQLLQYKGVLAFISSNSFLNAGFAEKLRGYLGQSVLLKQLIDFAETGVFEAVTEPCILILLKTPPKQNQVAILKWDEAEKPENIASTFAAHSFFISQSELTVDGWRLESPTMLRLLDKLRQVGTPLGEYVNGRFYYGIKTGLNEAFVVDRITRDRLIAEHRSSAEILKPFLRGRDVKRWRVEPQDLWLIFTRHGVDIKKYPAIFEHLSQYKQALMPGIPGGRKPGSYQWYEIQDNIAYWQEFEQPKIVYQDIARSYGMAWDDSGSYLANTCYFIPRTEKWLLAVLLSKAMRFYVHKTLGSDSGGFIRLFSIHVGKFPVAKPANPQKLDSLVDQILTAKQANPTANISALEGEIDRLVYQLYGLTEEEIAIVEGKA